MPLTRCKWSILSYRIHGSTLVATAFDIRFCTMSRSEEHTSELQSQSNLVCRLLLEKKKQQRIQTRELGQRDYGGARSPAKVCRTEPSGCWRITSLPTHLTAHRPTCGSRCRHISISH